MEYTIGLFITGLFILVSTIYRMRKRAVHQRLQQTLEEAYDVSNLDLSGNTQYAHCYSNKWVMDNITTKSHSKIGSLFQDHLANNTLLAVMWIGIIVGISSVIITLLFIESMRTIGTVIVIFILGVLIVLGPGGPRYSENLLDALLKSDITELNAHDFVYVKIANDTIRKSVIINASLGLLFILISPWADMLPILLAQGIAFVTVYLIWEPAVVLMNIHIALALLYIASFIGVFGFVCMKLGQKLTTPEE
ncbi:MAG: hypothetical protein ACTSYJ_01680 [Candidatus Thorarchaeota archaeon]